MTRKEAIEQLKVYRACMSVDGAEVEAYNMAIQALGQEPCEDTISRQTVQDYIAKYLSQYLYNDVREAVEAIDEYIGELPPVKPQESKTGHWKIIPFSNNYGEYRPNKYMCSECGWTIDLCRGLQQDTGHRLFCEHCGADMRKE